MDFLCSVCETSLCLSDKERQKKMCFSCQRDAILVKVHENRIKRHNTTLDAIETIEGILVNLNLLRNNTEEILTIVNHPEYVAESGTKQETHQRALKELRKIDLDITDFQGKLADLLLIKQDFYNPFRKTNITYEA